MNKLPEEIKIPWLAALRSGQYTQGTGQLRTILKSGKVTHCCIGVYGEVCGIPMDDSGMSFAGDRVREGMFYESLDKYIGFDQTAHLVSMNDGGKSFLEIADYIEQNL